MTLVLTQLRGEALYYQVKQWKEEFKNWQSISDILGWGLNNGSASRKGKRLKDKWETDPDYKFPRSPKSQEAKKVKPQIVSPIIEAVVEMEPTHAEVLSRIKRIKYGQLDPTGYQAKLDTVDDVMDWIKKYTPYKWDNKNIRENVEFLFFTIYKKRGKGLIFKPRDSGKSKSSIGVYLAIFANCYHTQLSIVNGKKMKRKIFYAMMRVLTRNSQFRLDYGDIVASTDKSMGEIQLVEDLKETIDDASDEPSFVVCGYNSIVGSHPYIVWLEDILQSEFKNADSNEYMLEEVFDAIIDKLTDVIGGTATRKGANDLYSNLRHRGFRFHRREAIKKISGRWPDHQDVIWDEVLDPEDEFAQRVKVGIDTTCGEFEIIERPGWDAEYLCAKREYNILKFEREMNNAIRFTDGTIFKGHHWHEVPRFKLRNASTFMAVDLSFGVKDGGDYFVILIGKIFQKKLYFVDCYMEQGLGIDDQLDKIIEYADTHKPNKVFIEANFWQNQQALRASKYIPNVVAVHQNIDKIDRIELLVEPMGEEKIVFFDDMPNKGLVKQQFMEFIRKKSDGERKDDAPDTIATFWAKLKFKLHSKRQKIFHKVNC